MMPTVDPISGRVMLVPRPKKSGGGGGGGAGIVRPAVTIVTEDPLTANEGTMIYNTTTFWLKVFVAGIWVAIVQADISGGLDNLLLSNDDHLLLSSGETDVLLLS